MARPPVLLLLGLAVAGCDPETGFGDVRCKLLTGDYIIDYGSLPVGVPTAVSVPVTADLADCTVANVNVLAVDSAEAFFSLKAWQAKGNELPADIENAEAVLSPSSVTIPVDTTFAWPLIYFSQQQDDYNQARVNFVSDARGATDATQDVRAHAGLSDVAIYPWTVDFGHVALGEQRSAFVTIDNRGDLPVAIEMRAADANQVFAAEPAIVAIEAGVRYEYEIVFKPNVSDTVALNSSVTFTNGGVGVGLVGVRANDCLNGVPSAYNRDHDEFTTCGGDCNDEPGVGESAYPGHPEESDGIDNDCNGLVDDQTDGFDDDGDGYCEHPTACSDESVLPGDCHDGDGDINPGVDEANCPDDDNPLCADGIDNDCDGTADGGTEDLDGDGYTLDAGDCDETDGTVAPNKPEKPDTKDNDCDTTVDEGTVLFDDDGDGYCEGMSPPPPGMLPNKCSNLAFVGVGDCDDSSVYVYPSPTAPEWSNVVALEWEFHGVDNDCDRSVDEGTPWADDDHDGYTEDAGDCDDANDTIGPFAYDPAGGPDLDCDGVN